MSKTVLCVLLKVLMSARADNSPKDLDSNVTQNLKSDQSHPDIVSVKNKIDEISFPNMSVIPESIESISKPTSPRAFVEFYNGFSNEKGNISVTFRWNQPESTDEIQGYTVQCWFIENLKRIQICDDKSISATILECTVQNLKPNTTYYFQVRAHTKVDVSLYTDLIDVSTTHENPIPQLLIVTENEGIDIWDLDSKINDNLVKDDYLLSAAYSIAEHKIYWSNKNKDLMMLDINENNITKIIKLQNVARNLCIDWIATNLYWIESNYIYYNNIMKLDLIMWEYGIIKYNKIFQIKGYYNIDRLTILPSIGTLFFRTLFLNDEEYAQLDLDGKEAHKIFSNICPFSLNMSNILDVKIDDMNTKKPLIYGLLAEYLFVTDNVSMCNLVLQTDNFSEAYRIQFQSFTIDKTNIYISIYFAKYIYVLKKELALLESVNAFKHIKKIRAFSQIYELHAFGKSLQPYPPTRCLTPDKKVYNVEILSVTTNSIIVNLPKLIPKSGCRNNLPTTLYTINISYCLDNELNKFDNFIVQTYERYYEIQNLTLTEYKLLLVRTSNFYSDQLSMEPLFDSEVIVMMRTKPCKFDAPENVTVETLTPTIAAVYWMPPKKLNMPVIYEVHLMCDNNKLREAAKSFIIKKAEHMRNGTFFKIMEELTPGQNYTIYVSIYPVNFSNHYNNSLNKTLYMYSEPNDIILIEAGITSINILWIPPVNLTINYVLEYKNVKMQKWRNANNFKLINRGKVMYYIEELPPDTRHEFRLILRYPKYEEDFIWPSDGRFIFSTLTSDISSTPEILIIQYYLPVTLSLVVIFTVICVCCFYYRQRKKSNKQVLSSILTDNELAILHEMPNGLTVQFNMSYNPVLQYDSDEYVLIKIRRDQIRLEKLLGSGAFGMVYQGKVKHLERTGIETSAAIKMLRKNASSQERKMFLEEARLMIYFRHKHVLRLLAICLDPECPSIVLELMEAGDLLQYLRNSRKLQPSNSQALRLQDLFAICEDVARGCRYLEYLRFVHRDLACRNCLVSARDRENRVVKIGDFGLTRDIYNSEYYRKKGQGLLPIRWMAPESLVVGTFTSQSDVWSFGVLMWEITSLGEHPYTGKTNQEVIDYVRDGGRLPIPLNCPPTLYELMLRCWNPANDRPNFKLCLKNIVALSNNIEDTLLNPMDII